MNKDKLYLTYLSNGAGKIFDLRVFAEEEDMKKEYEDLESKGMNVFCSDICVDGKIRKKIHECLLL